MTSRGRFGVRSRRSELLALFLGVTSGLVMLLAAAEIRSRPEWAGKLALDEAARELARAVEGEWTEMLRSPRFDARSASGAPIDVDGLDQIRLLNEPAVGSIGPDPPTDHAAFDALLVEARYQEIERKDLERAVGAITSALDLEIDPARRALGRLRAVQLGLRAEKDELVREQWAAVRTETEAASGSLAVRGLTNGISCALLTGLAVAEELDGEERTDLGRQLAWWWRTGSIGIVEGATIVRNELGILEARIKPELSVLLAGVVELADEEASDFEQTITARARLEVFVRWIEEGGDSPGELLQIGSSRTHLRFLARDDDLLVIRPGGPTICFFHSAELLRQELRRRLQSLASFGRGFRVDLTGEEAELGEEVRPWQELYPEPFGFLLRHENPAAFIEDEERRLGILQVALVVMGLFTLLAGIVSFGGLRRQRRLQELKTGFIARVSHELRTPITGILLASESLVEGRARTPERQERYFGLIRGEAKRLERLVANVLDFSRLDRGEGPRLDLEPVEARTIAEALASVVEDRCAAAEPELETRVEVGGGALEADVEALRRALVNLVDNAITHANASRIVFEAETTGGELVLALTDDGRGLEPRLRERVFEPFRQGPPEAERANGATGAGLGLAIVREIVHGHGGRISCETGANGVGCRFELRLPLKESEEG